MIHDPVSEVVGNIKCYLDMPLKATPKQRGSSAAEDTLDYEENCRTIGLETSLDNLILKNARGCVSLEVRNQGCARGSVRWLVCLCLGLFSFAVRLLF